MAGAALIQPIPLRALPADPKAVGGSVPFPASAPAQLVSPRDIRPLGQILIEDGAVDPHNLMKALVMRQRQAVRLGEILLANGWVQEEALTRAMFVAELWGRAHADA